jgi:hypothetical protein
VGLQDRFGLNTASVLDRSDDRHGNIGPGRTRTTARAGLTVPISLHLTLVEILTTIWLWIHWELHFWHCLTRLGGQ